MAWTFFEQRFWSHVKQLKPEDPGVADLVIEGKYSAMERPKRNFEQKNSLLFSAIKLTQILRASGTSQSLAEVLL